VCDLQLMGCASIADLNASSVRVPAAWSAAAE
jgi:hypothetical protein